MKNLLLLNFILAVLLVSCSKEDPEDNEISLSDLSIEIDYGSSYQLEATFNRSGYSLESLQWSSSDEEVATVSTNGMVSAKLTGDATITVQTTDGLYSKSSDLKVLATENLYREPVLEFGQNRTFVISNETRTLGGEDTDILLFLGENANVQAVMYLFEAGAMTSSAVLLKTDTPTAERAIEFLIQRYRISGVIDDIYVFERNGVGVGLTVEPTLGLMAIYVKDTFSENGRILRIESMIESMTERYRGFN